MHVCQVVKAIGCTAMPLLDVPKPDRVEECTGGWSKGGTGWLEEGLTLARRKDGLAGGRVWLERVLPVH